MYSCIFFFSRRPQKWILFDLIPDVGEFCLLLAEFRMVSLHLLKDQLDAPVKHLPPQSFLLIHWFRPFGKHYHTLRRIAIPIPNKNRGGYIDRRRLRCSGWLYSYWRSPPFHAA